MVPFTPLLELNNWWANLKSGFRPPHVPQMQHVDIKQSLNEISLLQLILSIKNLKLSSIDLYENKDRKKVLIYRRSDRYQICIRPDQVCLYVFVCLFIYFLFVEYIKLPRRAAIEKTNTPLINLVLPEKNNNALLHKGDSLNILI